MGWVGEGLRISPWPKWWLSIGHRRVSSDAFLGIGAGSPRMTTHSIATGRKLNVIERDRTERQVCSAAYLQIQVSRGANTKLGR